MRLCWDHSPVSQGCGFSRGTRRLCHQVKSCWMAAIRLPHCSLCWNCGEKKHCNRKQPFLLSRRGNYTEVMFGLCVVNDYRTISDLSSLFFLWDALLGWWACCCSGGNVWGGGAAAFVERRGTVRDQILNTLRCTLPIYRPAPHNFFHYRKDYFIDGAAKQSLYGIFRLTGFLAWE